MSSSVPARKRLIDRVEAALRRHPGRTAWVGVMLEVIAIGVIVAIVWHEVKREATILGEATKYAWRLGWHDALHDRRLLPIVILAIVVYLAGAMLISMRWVDSRLGLFVGVPVVALGSLAILGVLVLLIGVVVASDGAFDVPGIGYSGSGRRSRKPEVEEVGDDNTVGPARGPGSIHDG